MKASNIHLIRCFARITDQLVASIKVNHSLIAVYRMNDRASLSLFSFALHWSDFSLVQSLHNRRCWSNNNYQPIMPLFSTRFIFKRTRRPFEGCVLLSGLLIVFIVFTRWSLSSNQPRRPYEKVPENLYLPQEQARPKNKLPEPVDPIDTLDHGRPELAKYIHLDLKGAPPRAAPFYDSFFSFMNKLQMGVKGVLIEYEDTLPLQGNLANVSVKRNKIRVWGEAMWFV